MKHLDEFIIPLSGSKEGASEHSFELNRDFFDHFEDQEIIDADLTVLMTLNKSIRVFEMDFKLKGDLTVACDRCLDPMVQDIEYETELIVKYGEKYEEVDDMVVTIGPNDDEINIASFIYEYAKLALPIQRTHADGECNEDMLVQMEKYERKEEQVEEKTDSRWDALAKLKDKLN